MIVALIIALIVVTTIVMLYLSLRSHSMLLSRVRTRLSSGESVIFETPSGRSRLGWSAFLSFNRGVLVVTETRLLFGVWVLPLVWRLSEDLLLTAIEEVKSFEKLHRSFVLITVAGKRTMFTPTSNIWLPFGSGLSRRLTAAIGGGRLARA